MEYLKVLDLGVLTC